MSQHATAPTTPSRATLTGALHDSLATHDGVAMRSPDATDPDAITYAQLNDAAGEIGRGLIALGIEAGDRVAILAGTRPEWTLTDVGALWAGAVVVPIYQTNAPEECEYVLADSGARAVVCEDPAQLAKLEGASERCPQLAHRILMTGTAPGAMTLAELRERGRALDESVLAARAAGVTADDVATIVYTSGTTGPPKGCMLTHANLTSSIEMVRERLDLTSTMRVYLFLPLAHVLARVTQLTVLIVGGTIIFWRGDPKRIVDELAEARPTHFPSVPRVFEKVHTKILAGVGEQPRLQRHIFGWAIAEGARHRNRQRAGRPPGRFDRRRVQLADRLVLSKVRAAFGAGFQLGLTGAAPIGQEILEFFDACGVLVLEGYGLTETCATSTLNTVAAHRFGTVGLPLPGTEVRIAGDGELLLRGPNIFAGYHGREDDTAEVLQGGWLRTGDLGEIDADGFVRITGRKKDLIITSSGKNVSPSNIEEMLRETRWISQAVVFGDNRPYLVALLTLDPDEASALAEHVGEPPGDIAALSRSPAVRAELQASVDAVNARLARIEQIKRFTILDHDLDQVAGELTPTLKVKRAVVTEHYAPLVEELYT
ncbi:MAG: AMP-dependent synthetase/ligase [Solirubrobacteraceae bacterium]